MDIWVLATVMIFNIDNFRLPLLDALHYMGFEFFFYFIHETDRFDERNMKVAGRYWCRYTSNFHCEKWFLHRSSSTVLRKKQVYKYIYKKNSSNSIGKKREKSYVLTSIWALLFVLFEFIEKQIWIHFCTRKWIREHK